ncbi:MAG: outer membrane beta-barrel protein [Puniceicoccales bacterium]|jgi:opacity protein-like surface antigen|nr:outer membrane beta-barrel protein [Puniceicoccales bacterium]
MDTRFTSPVFPSPRTVLPVFAAVLASAVALPVMAPAAEVAPPASPETRPPADASADAVFRLGARRAREKDATGAADAYEAAAARGHPAAQYNLARCYYTGDGRPKNIPVAKQWLERAAAQNADAAIKKSASAWLDQIAAWEAKLREHEAKRRARETTTGAGTATAAAEAEPSLRPAATPPREHIALTVGAQLRDFSGAKTKALLLYGFSLHGGGFLGNENSSSWLLRHLVLTGDAGVYFGSATDIVLDTAGAYQPPDEPSEPDITQRDFNRRKSEYFALPAMLTLALNFDIARNFSVRAGPSIGATFLSVESDFDARTDYYKTADSTAAVRPSDYRREKASASKLLFSYGVTAGADWAFSRDFALTLQYRFSASTGADFGAFRNYGSSVAHQFNLGANWRF